MDTESSCSPLVVVKLKIVPSCGPGICPYTYTSLHQYTKICMNGLIYLPIESQRKDQKFEVNKLQKECGFAIKIDK
jgi:hypothetical protein